MATSDRLDGNRILSDLQINHGPALGVVSIRFCWKINVVLAYAGGRLCFSPETSS